MSNRHNKDEKSMITGTKETEELNTAWVQWDKRLELGIPRIDCQHRKLVAMCNELREALMNRQKRSKQCTAASG